MRTIKIVLIFFVSLLILTLAPFSFLYIKYKDIPEIHEKKSILLLGKGGLGHTAPDLTDTIILINVNPENKSLSTLSIPRDLWVDSIKAKVNTAYHYGGFDLSKKTIEEITGQQIANIVIVDFGMFKDTIDTIGGIEVDVESSFKDEKYPIPGKENEICKYVGLRTATNNEYSCRYETIQFEKGIQNMDGATALKFVRSRNSQSDEGTDLAREKRQQRVILALKNKILSTEVLLNPEKVKNLYEIVFKNLETDLVQDEILEYLKYMVSISFKFETFSIPEQFLKVSKNDKKYDYQYVFIPNVGSWKEIKEWINTKV